MSCVWGHIKTTCFSVLYLVSAKDLLKLFTPNKQTYNNIAQFYHCWSCFIHVSFPFVSLRFGFVSDLLAFLLQAKRVSKPQRLSPGRSFEEAAAILQTDLFEKQERESGMARVVTGSKSHLDV